MRRVLLLLCFFAGTMLGHLTRDSKAQQLIAAQGQLASVAPNSCEQTGRHNDQAKTGARVENTTIERFHWWSKSEWWLVIIAGLTGAVIGWQAWETRKAAEATKRNVDVIVAKERARVTIEINREAFTPPENWASAAEPSIGFAINLLNSGLTNAYRVAVYASVTVTDVIWGPPMGQAQFVSGIPDILKPDIKHTASVLDGDPFPTVADIEEIALRSDKKFMIFYGYLSYTDAFDQDREEPFRWLFHHVEYDTGDLFGMLKIGFWMPMPTTGDLLSKERPKDQNPN